MKQQLISLLVIAFLGNCASWSRVTAAFEHGSDDGQSSVADIEAVAIPRVAVTAEEHRALARSYEEEAASYRAREAAYRRNAYAEEQKVPVIPKNVNDDPRIKKIRQNRDELIARAERLAKAAERLALFHAMRATESRTAIGESVQQ